MKNTVIRLYHQNKTLFILYFIILIICSYVLLAYLKIEIHIFINEQHSSFLDLFFKYITFLGSGVFFVLLSLAFAIIKFRISIALFLSYILSGICVQLCKRVIFTEMERPVKALKGIYDLYLVNGVDMHLYKSFPSGHTATAFSLFIVMAFISNNRYIKLVCLITATLVGYSRIYLSQHFLIDVWAGSIIGLVSAIITYLYIYNVNYIWLDSSLLMRFKNGKK